MTNLEEAVREIDKIQSEIDRLKAEIALKDKALRVCLDMAKEIKTGDLGEAVKVYRIYRHAEYGLGVRIEPEEDGE